MINEELEFKILKLCSRHYLCASIEDNWYELSQEEQLEFIKENSWEPLENNRPEFIYDCIESAAQATQEFIENLLIR